MVANTLGGNLMIKIDLGHNYGITTNKRNFILAKYSNRKMFDMASRNGDSATYYQNMSSLLKAYSKILLLDETDEEVMTFEDFLKREEAIKDEISQITDKIQLNIKDVEHVDDEVEEYDE